MNDAPTPPTADDDDAHASRSYSDQIVAALAEGRNKRVRKLLRSMHPAKVAALLERLDPAGRDALWQQVDAAQEARIRPHLSFDLSGQFAGESAEALAENQLDAVRAALAKGALKRVGKTLQRMHPAKVAGLLEALPPAERSQAWSMVETDRAGRVLSFLNDAIGGPLAQELDFDDLLVAVAALELDDLVDLIQALPAELGHRLVHATAGTRRMQLESLLAYPEDSAGGLMNADAIAVRADVKVGTVLRYLRLLDTLPAQTDMLMVVDRKGHYQGALRLSVLVTADLDTRVSALMRTDLAGIAVDTPAMTVARQFEDLDLMSAPVVDAGGRLIGRITVDDVVDLIREDSERAVMQMAGLDEEADMFAPVRVRA